MNPKVKKVEGKGIRANSLALAFQG